MSISDRNKRKSSGKAVALYHRVYAHEGFEEAAQALFKLVQQAQQVQPNKKRHLFLDIDGHRNEQGGFDADMLELQTNFLAGLLSRYLTEVNCPLASAKNQAAQDNDIPDSLKIQSPGDQPGGRA